MRDSRTASLASAERHGCSGVEPPCRARRQISLERAAGWGHVAEHPGQGLPLYYMGTGKLLNFFSFKELYEGCHLHTIKGTCFKSMGFSDF